ncbi:hypothetical protein QCA50_002222 [Cerrena zonata]|uniref:FAD dependent oxidoreductase domain-containing protein n=1 Tax=Cerrena zonata TaxID=2478898 RepID=A0AAW0GYY4_9APHY
MSISDDKKHIVILGSGVIGLTIGHVITTKHADKYRVTIVARDMSEDMTSQGFSSPWAGANWSPFSDELDPATFRRESKTFNKFWEMESTGLTYNVPYRIFHPEANAEKLKNIWYKDMVRDFRVLEPEEIPQGFIGGVKFSTITVNPAKYLPWLKNELLDRGVVFVKRQIHTIGEAADIAGPDGIVFNATGLGARSLVGVEDKLVYPIRGQTILAEAPDVKECIALPIGSGQDPDGKVAYAIPRPSQGHVIIGGTYQKNNWDTSVDFDTAHSIWEKAVQFLPALKSEKSRIISHNVGLRPAREGGPRIELQRIKLPFVSDHMYGVKGSITEEKEFPVIHVYGFGGTGYQASWGSAEEAVDLLQNI